MDAPGAFWYKVFMRIFKLPTIVLTLALPALALAEFPGARPFKGVTYQAEVQADPPQRLFVAKVDLTDPQVHVDVAPGGTTIDHARLPGTSQARTRSPEQSSTAAPES